VSFADLSGDHDGVRQALEGLGPTPPAYLEPLRAALEKIERRQAVLLEESGRLEQALDTLAQERPPYAEVRQALAQAQASSEPLLKRRAESLAPALTALADCAERLEARCGRWRPGGAAGAGGRDPAALGDACAWSRACRRRARRW
jgi:hypothetical protein